MENDGKPAPGTFKLQYNLPPTFPLYREEQDHAVGQRPAQQPQESSHHTKRPERERQGEKQRERDVQQGMTKNRQDTARPV